MTVVLDASAVLVCSSTNRAPRPSQASLPTGPEHRDLAEVLSKLSDRGVNAVGLGDHLTAAGVTVHPMIERDAAEVAELRRVDTARVLSLGDRCCLALGRRLSAVVLTADRAWSALDTGLEVRQVR